MRYVYVSLASMMWAFMAVAMTDATVSEAWKAVGIIVGIIVILALMDGAYRWGASSR